jgi:multidrug efflux pump subunit AcrA (membrane-fusion protein)
MFANHQLFSALCRPLLLVLLAALCSALMPLQAEEAAPKVVSVNAVQKQTVAPQMMVSGQVYSRSSSNLSAGVDGRLEWIAEAGQQVEAGAVLAKLDPTPLKLRSNELKAQLKRSEINAVRLNKELTRANPAGSGAGRPGFSAGRCGAE